MNLQTDLQGYWSPVGSVLTDRYPGIGLDFAPLAGAPAVTPDASWDTGATIHCNNANGPLSITAGFFQTWPIICDGTPYTIALAFTRDSALHPGTQDNILEIGTNLVTEVNESGPAPGYYQSNVLYGGSGPAPTHPTATVPGPHLVWIFQYDDVAATFLSTLNNLTTEHFLNVTGQTDVSSNPIQLAGHAAANKTADMRIAGLACWQRVLNATELDALVNIEAGIPRFLDLSRF